MKYFHLAFFLSFFGAVLSAQTDSSLLLQPERLGSENILTRARGQQKVKAISATRSLEEVEDLPFSVWVITSEDILRNGFVTLGDVLKAAPGVRTSQPGNTLEGETFMLRGLSGNQYMKVLINDVPVTPSGARGMPIGAQIPIRQAERIEVFYGPASAVYGDGACAGVVNIILKETERPIFTQADLAFGSFGYNSLDLMLGGKLFKDEKVFRFSIYGSNTVREQSDIFYDDNLFKTSNYLLPGLDSTMSWVMPNYRARDFGDSIARTAQVPHESRLLGINLTWRGMHFNYNRMQRFDHSALGLSPLAASYANPSNRIAEQIETFAFSFQKKRRKRSSFNTFSIIRYKVDANSNFTPIFDRLSSALYLAKQPQQLPDTDRRALLNDIFSRYAFNERYFSASGLDVRYETRFNRALSPKLFLDAGLQVNANFSVPPLGYFPDPTEVHFLDVSGSIHPKEPFQENSEAHADLNGFAQLHWQSKKMTVVGGTAVNVYPDEPLVVAPRLALQYRLDSSWTLRASYSDGFRRPSVYARTLTYKILTNGAGPEDVEVGTYSFNQPERLRSTEFGILRHHDGFSSDLVFFYQEARNLIRDGYLYPEGSDSIWRYGFATAPGLSQTMWGIQGLLGNDLLNMDLNKNKINGGEVALRAEFYFQYARGKEWFGYNLPNTNDVRNFPRWIAQFRLSLHAQKWEFMMSSNRQNSILSGSVLYRDFYQRSVTNTKYPAYRTWDMMLRIYLSKHFLLYLHGQNIFNRHYAGIDATGTPDDLLYNPQPGRSLRFGVNYNMN